MKAKIIILTISLLLVFSKIGFSLEDHNISDEKSEQVGKETNLPQSEVNKTSDDILQIREYEVFGMDCPGCHQGLEKLIKKIPAVEEAEANWKKKRLTVTIRQGEELNDEDIYDAVKRANFTVGKRIK